MINAKEAQEATDKVNKEIVQSELESIEFVIESGIDAGEYEVVYTKPIGFATIDALRTLEYSVDDGSEGVTISWE